MWLEHVVETKEFMGWAKKTRGERTRHLQAILRLFGEGRQQHETPKREFFD